jgi:hypothetical protein
VIKPPSNFNGFNRRLEYSIKLQDIADRMVDPTARSTEPTKIFSGTFLMMAICTWDRPPSPPPPRVAGQCEAQRAFCSLRLISLSDLAGNAQVERSKSSDPSRAGRKQKNSEAAGAPALARHGIPPSEAWQKGR